MQIHSQPLQLWPILRLSLDNQKRDGLTYDVPEAEALGTMEAVGMPRTVEMAAAAVEMMDNHQVPRKPQVGTER